MKFSGLIAGALSLGLALSVPVDAQERTAAKTTSVAGTYFGFDEDGDRWESHLYQDGRFIDIEKGNIIRQGYWQDDPERGTCRYFEDERDCYFIGPPDQTGTVEVYGPNGLHFTMQKVINPD